MNIYSWSFQQFESFLIIFTRVSFILFMMPLIGSRNLPVLPKIGLSFMTSFILLPVVEVKSLSLISAPISFTLFIVREALIGFILGFSIRLAFVGVQLAGEIMGFQMGFGMANVLDPQSGLNSSVMSQFQYFVALLIFLSIDGHHWFFKALAQSFQLITPGGISLREGMFRYFLGISGNMFHIAIKIVAPVMAILIFIQLSLGIIARMIPQINLLISSFPLTIGLGLIVLGLSLDLLWPLLKGLFEDSGKALVSTLIPLMKEP
jgi:flagellar biosynthetic protein FliR